MSRQPPPLKSLIVEKALAHFASNGFDGASTRDIAQDCDTPMSSITYHFGGKEGLYLAVAEHIAEQINARMAVNLGTAAAAIPEGPDAARTALLDLLVCFAEMMLDPALSDYAMIVTREQQRPGPAFEKLFEGFLSGLVATALALIRACRPELPVDEAKALGTFLLGQVTVLRTCKATVARTFGTTELAPDVVALLKTTLRRTADKVIETREMIA